MWTEVLKDTVLKPLLSRVGTFLAGMLVFGGDWLCKTFDACGLVTANGAEMVVAYVTAVALLCFDLFVAWLNRRARAKR